MKALRRVLTLLIVVGCVTTKASLMDTSLHPQAICKEGVKLYTDASKIGVPYTEIAVLHSTGTRMYTNEESMIGNQRKKAAELGANGLVLGANKDPSTGAVIASSLGFGSANRKGDALAVLVPSDSARVSAICSAKADSTK
jgi:hypothetical protein